MDFRLFLRNVALWSLPVFSLWWLFTPVYNRFLIKATENLVRMLESPNHTTLANHDDHYFLIYRDDLRGRTSTGHVYSVRATDTHFPLYFTGLLFLAVPGVALRERLTKLGWATLLSVFFHLVSLVFWVHFAYTTQLGDWSVAHYSTFQQNFWGLGKHLLDLPFKFALPLVLWVAFFWQQLPRFGEAPTRSK